MKRSLFYGLAITWLLLISIFTPLFAVEPASAQGGNELPVVAINVSQNTEDHWTNIAWNYFSIYGMLEEALRSDGTPFVEVSDAEIEAGELLSGGLPKYPILFSLAAECVSDLAISQIEAYANAGGFVYVGSSSWTKYSDGSPRTDFPLSNQMGVTCESSPPNDWFVVQYATRIANHRLVNDVPYGLSLDWALPLTLGTNIYGHTHYVWGTQVTSVNPAQVLMTTEGHVMIATKACSSGQFIYDAVLAELTGSGATRVHTYSYLLFRRAVEWAFETQGIPLVRLSAWKYQYDSAFIVRHDMCFQGGGNWYSRLDESAQYDKSMGINGEYYVVTSEAIQNDEQLLISWLQQARSLGALIGTHNNVHTGPDEYISSGDLYNAVQQLNISLNYLESWLGIRPVTFVAPNFNGYFSQSLAIYESLGIKTSGEQCIGPFPHMGLSLITRDQHFDNLVLPPQEFYTSSGTLLQSIESGHNVDTIKGAVDLVYGIGALANVYFHQVSDNPLPSTYITYCLSKPNMWATNNLELYNWWLLRQQIATSPTYEQLLTGERSLTVTLSGSASPDACLDIAFPVPKANMCDLQVQIDGSPSTNFRQTASGIKVKVGTASTVTVTWGLQESWTQTSQADFQSGTLTNLDAATVPDQVSLAASGTRTLTQFSDNFIDASWTNSHWTVKQGIWNVTGIAHWSTISWTTSAPLGTSVKFRTRTAPTQEGLASASWSDYYTLSGATITSPDNRYIQYEATLSTDDSSVTPTLYDVTISYTEDGNTYSWTQTSQADFQSGTLTNLDAAVAPGQVSLAANGTGTSTLFSDNFTDASWTNSHWTVRSGNWIVSSDYYQNQPSSGWSHTYAGDASWTNYVLEAKWRYVSGGYGGGIAARLNSGTGARYAFWIYPSVSGPNKCFFGKFSSWEVYAPFPGYPTGYVWNSTPTPTDTNWHLLRMELLGSSIKCYYDDVMVFDVVDTSYYSAGKMDFECYGSSTTYYDWVEVRGTSVSYWSSGTLVSGTFDATTDVYKNWPYTSNEFTYTYAGDSSWSNYVVEARWRYVSGGYGGGIAARLDNNTGARYAFWVYPNSGGPNKCLFAKFGSWTGYASYPGNPIGYEYNDTPTPTDTNWHLLRMELLGSNVKCYYDGVLVFDITDPGYSTGRIDFECYGSSTTCYDWVTVNKTSAIYYASGTLVSSSFDAATRVHWKAVSWTASSPTGTQIQFRTRTAPTEVDLDSAPWSDYYTSSGDSISSPDNRFVQYEATLSTTDPTVTSTLYDVTIGYSETLATTLHIDPSTTAKTSSDVNTTFKVNVTITDVTNLQGFDCNVTWDKTLLTLTSVDFNTTLDNVWGSGNWQLAINQSGAGYFKLVAVSTASSFSGAGPTSLWALTFRIEDPHSNFLRSTTLHFDTHKLSDPSANPIVHVATDGTYSISGETPTLQMSPTSKTCRTYGETFNVSITVSNEFAVAGFEFEIHYNTTLLDYSGITWKAWESGAVTVDETNGIVAGSTTGGTISGSQILITVQFTAAYHHIWKDESKVSSWKNDQNGTIFFQSANLTYSGSEKLHYVKGGVGEVSVSPDVNYTFSPIQGDITSDGVVDIFDLRAVAAYFDVKQGDPLWSDASIYDLNGNDVIDIYDLVLVGANFGYPHP